MASIQLGSNGISHIVHYKFWTRIKGRDVRKQRGVTVASKEDAEALIALAIDDDALDIVVRNLYGPPPQSRIRGLPYKEPRAQKPCEICGRETKLAYDHDHKTGLHRGWLCTTCNSGLGMFKDNVSILASAIVYLNNHQKTYNTEVENESCKSEGDDSITRDAAGTTAG